MLTDAELIQRLREKGTKLATLSQTLSPAPSDLGNWHRHVLTSLALVAAQHVRHISSAAASPEDLPLNLSYLAWAVRSLFEVRLWTHLAENSKEARRFMGGVITDGLDIFGGFNDLVQQHLTDGGLAEKFVQLKDQLEAALQQVAMSKKELKFNVADEAKKLGLEREYQQAYKFTSKLAHVTARASLLSYQPGLAVQTARAMMLWADEYLQDIIETLEAVSSGGADTVREGTSK